MLLLLLLLGGVKSQADTLASVLEFSSLDLEPRAAVLERPENCKPTSQLQIRFPNLNS